MFPPIRSLSKNDAAKYLGVSRRTIERYIEAGKLKTRRLESPDKEHEYLDKVLIPIEQLDSLYERGIEV